MPRAIPEHQGAEAPLPVPWAYPHQGVQRDMPNDTHRQRQGLPVRQEEPGARAALALAARRALEVAVRGIYENNKAAASTAARAQAAAETGAAEAQRVAAAAPMELAADWQSRAWRAADAMERTPARVAACAAGRGVEAHASRVADAMDEDAASCRCHSDRERCRVELGQDSDGGAVPEQDDWKPGLRRRPEMDLPGSHWPVHLNFFLVLAGCGGAATALRGTRYEAAFSRCVWGRDYPWLRCRGRRVAGAGAHAQREGYTATRARNSAREWRSTTRIDSGTARTRSHGLPP